MFFQKYKNLFIKPQKDFLFFNTFLNRRMWIFVAHLLYDLYLQKSPNCFADGLYIQNNRAERELVYYIFPIGVILNYLNISEIGYLNKKGQIIMKRI